MYLLNDVTFQGMYQLRPDTGEKLILEQQLFRETLIFQNLS